MLHRRIFALLLAFCLLIAPAAATWSIVVVNTRTGEVAVGVATCLTNFNLRKDVAVLVPGFGAGAAQCLLGGTVRRSIIWEQLQLGTPPDQILDQLSNDQNFDLRQYGIVDLQGRALSYTGVSCGEYKGQIVGGSGDLVYAIQGNVLTGAPVLQNAESALINTPGDLAEKLMAAMEAARAMGGDGRCSCDPFDPPSCGSPPPSFNKAAHVATMLIGRMGDPIEPCAAGCARGDFYLALNEKNLSASDPDPILLLRQDYNAWRAALIGRPDGILSQAWTTTDAVPAGSTTPIQIEVELYDVDGNALTTGGATVTLEHDPRSAGESTLQNVVDHGNGTYTLNVLPGQNPGRDLLRVVVDDGVLPVTLWPPVALLLQPAPQVPFNGADPIAGLNPGGNDAQAQLMQDGLRAFFLQGQGAAAELMRTSRPTVNDPFGASTRVEFATPHGWRISDFWISDDELELIASGFAPGSSVQRLFHATRTLASDPFGAPEVLEGLDSGQGESGPALSADGLDLVFASHRSGNWDLWTSHRFVPEGAWLPPIQLTELDRGGDEASPLWIEGGTRLLYSEGTPSGGGRLMSAELLPDGSHGPPQLLPGAIQRPGTADLPCAYDPVFDRLWYAERANGSDWRLLSAKAAYGSLSAQPDSLSAAGGGAVDFTLDAGPDWAGASYLLVGGGSGATPGAHWNGTVLPLAADEVSDYLRNHANDPGLSGFRGSLDANGQATARLDLPPGAITDPALIGITYRFAYVASTPSGSMVSNATTLRLDP